jgi:ADP-ribose pyrophosphatase
MIKHWKLLDSTIESDCRVFSVRTERAVSPRTGKNGTFHTIDSAPWVNVIAITNEGDVVLIRQYRHGNHQVTLEIPGGLGEEADPADAAIRELLEETGFEGDPPKLLGSVSPNPALFSNRCYTYLIENVRETGSMALDENEDIEVELFPLSRISSLIRDGSIDHALVIAAFHFYFAQTPSNPISAEEN